MKSYTEPAKTQEGKVMPAGIDKRRYRRVNYECTVRLMDIKPVTYYPGSLDADSLKQEIWRGKSINISACGILIHTRNPIMRGKIKRIIFMEPNSFNFFDGIGEVIRVEMLGDGSFCVGIDFLNRTETDYKKFDFHISNLYDEHSH